MRPVHREILGQIGAEFGLTADEVAALTLEDFAVLRSNLQARLDRTMAALDEALPRAVDDFLAQLFPTD